MNADYSEYDERIVASLKKSSFNPSSAISLIQERIGTYHEPSNTRLTFLQRLPHYLEKFLKRKYTSCAIELQISLFDFLAKITEFSIANLQDSTSAVLDLISLLLTYNQKCYNSYKTKIAKEAKAYMNSKLESLRKLANDIYKTDNYLSVNLYFECVCTVFAENHGFERLFTLLDSRPSSSDIIKVFKIVENIKSSLTKNKWFEFFEFIARSTEKIFLNLSPEEVKSLQHLDLELFLKDFEKFLLQEYMRDKTAEIIEKCELEVTFILLNSSSLEKKILGIEGINKKISQVKETSNGIHFTMFREVKSRYFTTPMLLAWLDEKNLLEIIFGVSCHAEVIKRSKELMRFLYLNARITVEKIFEVLEKMLNKHQIYKEAALDLIEDVILNMKVQDLIYLRNKVLTLDPKFIDIQLIRIIKTFNYIETRSPMGFGNQSFDAKPKELHSHLRFLWDLWLQPNPSIAADIIHKAFTTLKESLTIYIKSERKLYIDMCLENINMNMRVSQSLELLRALLESFPILLIPSYNTVSRADILRIYDKVIVKTLFISCLTMKKALTDSLKTQGVVQPSDRVKKSTFLVGINEFYLEGIEIRLNFLRTLYCYQKDMFSISHLNDIWTIFIENSLGPAELNLIFNFLMTLIGNNEVPILPHKAYLTIFCDFILKISPISYTPVIYQCFERYFLLINSFYSNVSLNQSDSYFKVHNFELIGSEFLWSIILHCENDSVFVGISHLLKQICSISQGFNSQRQQEFIAISLQHIGKAQEALDTDQSVSKVCRCIEIIKGFIGTVHTSRSAEVQSQVQGYLIEICVKNNLKNEGFNESSFEKFYSFTTWKEVKESIAKKHKKSIEEVIFKVNGLPIFGEDGKRLEDVANGGVLDLEICNAYDKGGFGKNTAMAQNISQLKSIFEYIEDQVIMLALDRSDNSTEDAALLLMDEQIVESLRKEAMKTSVNQGVNTIPDVNHSAVEPLSDFSALFDTLFQISGKNNLTINLKILEILQQLPTDPRVFSRILNLEVESPKGLLRLNNRIKFWYSLEVIQKILNSENRENWLERFFELGGFFHLYSHLIKYKKHGLSVDETLNCKCLEGIIITMLQFLETNVQPVSNFAEIALNIIDEDTLIPVLVRLLDELIVEETAVEGLMEKGLDLLNSLAVAKPSIYLRLYNEPLIKQLISITLLSSSSSSLRYAVKRTIKSFVVFLASDNFSGVQHFWNILSQSLPKNSNSNCQEFFDLCLLIIETQPHISEEFILECVEFILSREINEDHEEDSVIAGYFKLASALLKSRSTQLELSLTRFVYSAQFDLNIVGDTLKSSRSPPLLKKPATRSAAFKLLVTLILKGKPNYDYVLSSLAVSHGPQKLYRHHSNEYQRRSDTGFVGLRNFGCTCYLNASMQQLFMIEAFREGILESGFEAGADLAGSLLFQMQVLMANLKYSEKQCFEPNGVIGTFRGYDGEPINVRVQQDADEFLNILFDKLEDLLKQTEHKDFIKRHVGGSIIHEIKSLEEKFPYQGEREEHFYRISLDVKNNKTLAEALDLYIKADVLEGENKYLCEEFNEKIEASKRCILDNLANTVIIHLKRFEFNISEMRRIKINDRFEFPLAINFKKWCKERDHGDEYYEYELVGVIVHSGSADSGHYYSFIKDRVKSRWFKFDDRYVENYNIDSLSKDCFGGESSGFNDGFGYDNFFNAYILVYERKTFEEIPQISLAGRRTQSYLNRIVNDIVQENIYFLQDCMYFDSTYEEFLKELFSSCDEPPQLESNKGLSLGIEGSISAALREQKEQLALTDTQLNSNYLESDHWKAQVYKIEKSLEIENSEFKLLKLTIIYVLEILVKAGKTQNFTDWAGMLLKRMSRHSQAAVWMMDLLGSSQKLFFRLLDECNDEKVKNAYLDFVFNALEISIDNEEQYLTEKVRVANVHIIAEETQLYVAASSRFMQIFSSEIIENRLKYVGIIGRWVHFIEKSFVKAGKMLLESNIVFNVFRLSLNNSTFPTLDTAILYEHISYLVASCKTNQITSESLLYEQPCLQHDSFVSILVADLNRFSCFFEFFCTNNLLFSLILLKELISSFCDSFKDYHKFQHYLDSISAILQLNDSIKIARIREFFKIKLSMCAGNSFFEEIYERTLHHTPEVMKVTIWWSKLIKDDSDLLAVTQENLRMFRPIAKLKAPKALQTGKKSLYDELEEAKKLLLEQESKFN